MGETSYWPTILFADLCKQPGGAIGCRRARVIIECWKEHENIAVRYVTDSPPASLNADFRPGKRQSLKTTVSEDLEKTPALR